MANLHGTLHYQKLQDREFFKLFPIPGTRFRDDVFKRIAVTPLRTDITTSVPVAYTYFGQFVAHEITHLLRGSDIPGRGPVAASELTNLRSPSLDLDSLYGDPIGFGDNIPNENFKFTSNRNYTINEAPAIYDLHRTWRGKALIGDERNDENLLVSQLHTLFMNAHNKLFDEYVLSGSERPFEGARKELTLIFQQILRNDFLARILNREVYDNLFDGGFTEYLLNPAISESAKIPIEFSGAAFRFGHSLVRDSYTMRKNSSSSEPVGLADIFRLTGFDKKNGWREIGPNGFLADWKSQLDFSKYGIDNGPETTFAFDMGFTQHMSELPNEEIDNNNVVMRNLRRGREIDLPSGQDIIQHIKTNHFDYYSAMKLKPIEIEDIHRIHNKFRNMLRDLQLDRKMPLWMYVLTEPVQYKEDDQKHTRLGTLGSIIVGETLRAILLTSRYSIYNSSLNSENSLFVQYLENHYPDRRIIWEDVELADMAQFVHHFKKEK